MFCECISRDAVAAPTIGLALALATVVLPGCSTMSSLTAAPVQTVAVNTNPHGAVCTLERDGAQLASVTTPNEVKVAQRGGDMTVKCRHPEYETTAMVVKAENRSAEVSDVLAAASATKYANNITIPMRVKGSTPPARSPKRVAKATAAKTPAKTAAQAAAAAASAGAAKAATKPAAAAASQNANTPEKTPAKTPAKTATEAAKAAVPATSG